MLNDFNNIHFCSNVKKLVSSHLKECNECRTALTIINDKILSLPFVSMFLSEKERQELNTLFINIIKE